jgi:N-acetylmuramoyl-L-alanine amidase
MKRLAMAAAAALVVGCLPSAPPGDIGVPLSEEATGAVPSAIPPDPLVRSVRRVVVDAGHGGEDLGAIGVSGVQEKDITLAIARVLARLLSERGIEVVQTRPEDVAVALARRAEITNASGAGLFVSIHANSADSPLAHGVETYSMEVAADEAAMRLAERENRDAAVAGHAPRERDLEAILHELRQGAVAAESSRFASALHGSLVSSLQGFYGTDRIVDRFVRTAPFWVLVDSEVPAVLVEVGYLSNATEERRLRTGGYHHRAAEALADAIEAWVQAREASE